MLLGYILKILRRQNKDQSPPPLFFHEDIRYIRSIVILYITQSGDYSLFLLLKGGTGDITIHEVQDDHSLHEKNMATGGAWGGGRINKAFLQIWKDILGKIQ
jgi:hypothetical protein